MIQVKTMSGCPDEDKPEYDEKKNQKVQQNRK